ncbi:Na+/H+ antiporter NhaC family protein [Biformimicrobium ophioploci]|uniref:Na+/H+ antiporter NhaC family protein n=1 Tax=Biformimicrobium ophioploci TaxID=3036711 RepID=A0ABQ6LZ98_9GAMM|nr:Na+/H+ antiporter NhaC family protein [Microbulbifer sp. NKW57]GMG87423.1 Na+/H+ antiporter NhaC family protein [Microbulbifer sp. NKW57]
MTEASWISILPPLLAIVLAISTRQVLLSLFLGVWLGYWLIPGGNPLSALAESMEGLVEVLSDAGDTKVIMFTLMIGGLIAILEACGGVRGFVNWLEKRNWVNRPGQAQWLSLLIGVVIFIESNITVLVAGSVCRPLFDKMKIAREKLAYLIDSTSAPICILIPLNAWGAFNLGLLEGTGVENSLELFLASIPLNFYAISALLLAVSSVAFNWNFDGMGKAMERTRNGELHWPGSTPVVDEELLSPPLDPSVKPRAVNMLLPIIVMVVGMPVGLWITGDGNLMKGSGSTSVLWAVGMALLTAATLVLTQRQMSLDKLNTTFVRGAGGVLPLAMILLLALALGDVTGKLKTAEFVSAFIGDAIPVAMLPALIFLVSGAIAFSVGSSWGTFAIMLPIAVAVAGDQGMALAPVVAAVLSGGIFGDHASPISDTTIVSSMASACDHIDHVKTQLPYALIAGGIAFTGFVITGMTM